MSNLQVFGRHVSKREYYLSEACDDVGAVAKIMHQSPTPHDMSSFSIAQALCVYILSFAIMCILHQSSSCEKTEYIACRMLYIHRLEHKYIVSKELQHRFLISGTSARLTCWRQ